jgi:hypothetical protein
MHWRALSDLVPTAAALRTIDDDRPPIMQNNLLPPSLVKPESGSSTATGCCD